MAVKWMDAFNHHASSGDPSDAAQWYRSGYYADRGPASGDGPEWWPNDGPFGGPVWSFSNNTRWGLIPLPVTGPTFLMAGWVKWTTGLTVTHGIWSFYEFGTTNLHCQLQANGTGTMSVKRGGTTLGTTSWMAAADRWYHVALKYNIHDTTGFFELRINNQNELSDTGLDTKEGSGNAEVSVVQLHGMNTDVHRFTQMVFWDTAGDAPTDFFGLHKMWTLRPNGDSTPANWTPQGAGANYVEVDEAEADDDTTYNETATPTDQDRLDLESLPETPDTIFAVQSRVLVRQTVAGNLKLKNGVFAGTTESLSAARGVGLDWDYHTQLETDNPDDSLPWEEADVNALEVVYEAV